MREICGVQRAQQSSLKLFDVKKICGIKERKAMLDISGGQRAQKSSSISNFWDVKKMYKKYVEKRNKFSD